MPSSQLSLVAAALAGVLALASAAGESLMAGGIAVVQIVFALGVIRSSELRSARPAAWLALVAGLAVLLWIERAGTPDLTPMGVILGPTVLVAFIVQLARRDGRPSLNRALALVVTACVLTALPAAWLALRATGEGEYVVGLALLGVAAVAASEALPISRALRRVLGVLVASTGAAVLVVAIGSVDNAVPAVSAVVISAFCGVMAAVAFAVADRLAGEITQAEVPVLITVAEDSSVGGDATLREWETAGAREGADQQASVRGGMASIAPLRIAAPFVAAAPAAYVLGRLLVG